MTKSQANRLRATQDTSTARQGGASYVDAWILARYGIPLDLATLKTFTARLARHQAEDEDVDVYQ